MSLTQTLHGATAAEIMADVYFRPDFVALHARPDRVDALELAGFRHSAAVREIPGTDLDDLETPWGYGGPVALDEAAFWQGLGLWRQRQIDNNRVAEFVRLHPFLNPMSFRGWFDHLRLDRLTIVVDLAEAAARRWHRYSKGTRYSIRQAQKKLTFRVLGPGEGGIFRRCYEEGLERNQAERHYYFPADYYEAVLAADWATAWVAELAGEPVAIACFLDGGAFAHYHLSGGGDAARETFAHYGLLELAIAHFAAKGARWMHLGGGRTSHPDDALLAFKAKFSPRRVPYYTGGLVYARGAYEQLARQQLSRGRNERFLSYRFAPAPEIGSKPITLRRTTAADFAAFFRLKCDVDNIVWSGHDRPPDWHRMGAWFEAQHAPGSNRRIYLAEYEGQVLGYTYADDLGDAVEITIGVASREAGRGLGRNFLRQLMAEIAKSNERRRIQCWIFPENVASVKAFEAVGFRRDEARTERVFDMPFMGGPARQHCWVHDGAARA